MFETENYKKDTSLEQCIEKWKSCSEEVTRIYKAQQEKLQKMLVEMPRLKNRFVEDYSLESMGINRYEVELRRAPVGDNRMFSMPSHGTVIIVGDRSEAVISAVRAKGYIPVTIGPEEDYEEMKRFFDKSFAGVISIADSSCNEDEGLDFVKRVFFAAKHTANTWFEKKVVPFFVAVTKLGGTFGIDGTAPEYVTGSVSGICKSAKREWADRVSVHYIDVYPEISYSDLFDLIWKEVEYGDIVETGYAEDKQRRILALNERYEKRIDDENLPDENDVFLCAGGGEGVTSECIMELGKRFHSKFIIFGMNKIDDGFIDPYPGINHEEMAVKIAAESAAKGKRITPSEADRASRAIVSQRQLRKTVSTLKKYGCQVDYYQCDVTEKSDLKKIIERSEKRMGPVTGIVHGAGVLHDCLLNKKEETGFDKVFGVKYSGIRNMLELIDISRLKYMLLYSSIAGFFGNFGQSDYSCGNEYLNHLARYYNNTLPTCKVMSMNWGPWNGGMVDHVLKNAMIRRGKNLIELDEGKMFFVDAFAKKWNKSDCQLIINDENELGGDF